jgi:circadian clock protein KaiC
MKKEDKKLKKVAKKTHKKKVSPKGRLPKKVHSNIKEERIEFTRPKKGIIEKGKEIVKSVGKKVKQIKSPRVKSGIQGFDKMTRGGYKTNSINLVVGGVGAGKSIMAYQFLQEGLNSGEKVLYVSFEEKKQEFYANMKKFGWDLEKEELKGNLVYLEYSPEKVKMMLDEGGGSIESIILKKGITRLVFDSITSFTMLFGEELSKREAILALFDIVRRWNTTILLIVQEELTSSKSRVSWIEFQADSVILLNYVKMRGERMRTIEILKMRGTEHSKETKKFLIGKKGIEIDITKKMIDVV